jgi:hypothetical protein
MDIAEIAEKMYGIKLSDWQKEHIRTLDKFGKKADIRIVMPRHNGRDEAVYFYLNTKELILNGKTNNSK